MTNNIVAQEIFKVAINKYNATGNIGLLSERSEIGLAMCYLYLYTNEKNEEYLNELYKLINLQIYNWNKVDNSNTNFTFGYGLKCDIDKTLFYFLEKLMNNEVNDECLTAC